MVIEKKSNQKEKNPQNRIEFVRFLNPEDGLYYYRYDDENNEVFLISANGYTSSGSCEKGIETLKNNISSYKTINKNQQFQFVIKSIGNNAILAKSKEFTSIKEAKDGYNWLKDKFSSSSDDETPTVGIIDENETEVVNSNTGTNQRYAFRLTFYPEGNSSDLRGNIEYVLGEKKSSFQGLDIKAIYDFLRENLPLSQGIVLPLSREKKNQVTEKQKQKVIKLESEKLKLKFIQEGIPIKDNSISINSNKKIEAQINLLNQAETLPEKGDYEVFLYAKSLQTGKKILAGQTIGSFPDQEQLKLPVNVNSLSPGPYQIMSSLIWSKVEDKKESKEESVSGSCYIMVY